MRRQRRAWKRAYFPTAEEIAAACERIREGESEKQLRRRAGVLGEPYTVPEIAVPPDVAEKLNRSRSETDSY